MRTIKFRGKRVENGEWVYGYLQKYQETHASRLCICAVSVRTWRDALLYEVVPDTVGQFTGLLDKNGKEIYEGDVVNFDNYLQGRSYVEFDRGCFWVASHNYTTTLTYRVSLHTHIVGNIHDNPELMKQNE